LMLLLLLLLHEVAMKWELFMMVAQISS